MKKRPYEMRVQTFTDDQDPEIYITIQEVNFSSRLQSLKVFLNIAIDILKNIHYNDGLTDLSPEGKRKGLIIYVIFNPEK